MTKEKDIVIKLTTDYGQFKIFDSNRTINPGHVNKLKRAIQKNNLLHLNPIIVDTERRVIDGQHRLCAAKELGITIYYMVDDKIAENDIADLNSNKSNWTLMHYVNYWAAKGKTDFIKLRAFITRHSEINITTCMRFLFVSDAFKVPDAIRSGNWLYNNEEEFQKLLSYAKDFKHFEKRFDREFLYSLRHCIESGEYVHEVMIQKYSMCQDKLVVCGDQKQYITILEDIYNFHNTKNVVNFRMSKKQRAAYKDNISGAIIPEQKKAKPRGIESRLSSLKDKGNIAWPMYGNQKMFLKSFEITVNGVQLKFGKGYGVNEERIDKTVSLLHIDDLISQMR